jgi:hypothetical protein
VQHVFGFSVHIVYSFISVFTSKIYECIKFLQHILKQSEILAFRIDEKLQRLDQMVFGQRKSFIMILREKLVVDGGRYFSYG